MSETTQLGSRNETTQLASRNETTQLASRNETTQLVSRNETTQLCTAVDRLQPPLQQNRLFLPTNLLMIISASITNELATKMKHFVRRLPYLFSTRHEEIKFKLKQNLMQENCLTLWKTYVFDRSLAIASFWGFVNIRIPDYNLREDS
ncbi:hypothetical protein TNCV_323871 [Trichonephila clavipes]|nr:hypothetical protein TNCV_323871 [Trichonephila clavipes]